MQNITTNHTNISSLPLYQVVVLGVHAVNTAWNQMVREGLEEPSSSEWELEALDRWWQLSKEVIGGEGIRSEYIGNEQILWVVGRFEPYITNETERKYVQALKEVLEGVRF